jgi:hypothetical protein
MCAHRIYVKGQYVVLSCSKKFEDNSIRKVKVFKISDGLLIGGVSIPAISVYKPSPVFDDVALQKIDSGLRVAIMINGTGILLEAMEYRNNIGFRVHVNAF